MIWELAGQIRQLLASIETPAGYVCTTFYLNIGKTIFFLNFKINT